MTNKRSYWEVRYNGDFGKSLFGNYIDYEVAKAEADAFVRRCRGEVKKVGSTVELVKVYK